MKIKVEYYLPRLSVSEEVEIGNITNNHLSKRQSSKIDKLIKDELSEKLMEKLKQTKPKSIIKAL